MRARLRSDRVQLPFRPRRSAPQTAWRRAATQRLSHLAGAPQVECALRLLALRIDAVSILRGVLGFLTGFFAARLMGVADVGESICLCVDMKSTP